VQVDEIIANNADEIWLHQNEMWELIDIEPEADMQELSKRSDVLE